MKMTEKKDSSRIQAFSNYEEAAIRDSEDFEETEPAKGSYSNQLSSNFTVRLSPPMLKLLRKHAEARGIAPSTLARMWLVERLREDEVRNARQVS